MRKITIAAISAAATLISAPAFATSYTNSYGHGHSSHSSYGHSHGHSSYGHSSYGHTSYKPAYHAPVYHAPAYVAPTYHAPVYVAPQPTTSYETRPAYVYQKVAGYCTDVVKSTGYNTHRKTVECKAGEAPKVEQAPEAPVEPPK